MASSPVPAPSSRATGGSDRGPTGPGSASPREWLRLRRFAVAALVTNILIVFTGGIVRVTGSGLGCSDWPTCDGQNIAPTRGSEGEGWHEFIEFGNRLLTFVVLAAAVAVFVQVRRTRPHDRTIELMAWALPLGVVAQAVLGGITVLTGLSPYTVAAHFLLSMALITAAVVLHERVRAPEPAAPPSRGLQHATSVLLVVAGVVLVLGTVVTGAGPHGGDVSAPRFDVDIRLMAIAHADAVWALVGLTVALLAVTWRSGPPRLRRAVRALFLIELLQGALGYTQYALGIPAVLVAGHILGAALLWATATAVWIRARPPGVATSAPPVPPAADQAATRDAAPSAVADG
jgi:heme a synthase